MSKHNNDITERTSVSKAVKDIDTEYFKKVWDFSNAVAALNTFRVKTPEEMETRIQELFNLCSDRGMMPTYESIAVACGIPIRTFYDMRAGEFDGYVEYSQIIKKAKDQISMIESCLARDGKIPPVLWIFRAKNYMGMKDVQQVEVSPTSSGDVPNNSGDLVAALPEIPNNAEIEEKTPIIMDSSSESIDKNLD